MRDNLLNLHSRVSGNPDKQQRVLSKLQAQFYAICLSYLHCCSMSEIATRLDTSLRWYDEVYRFPNKIFESIC